MTLLALFIVVACGQTPAAPQSATALPDGYVATTAYQRQPTYTFCFSNASVSNSWRLAMAEHVRYAVRHRPEITAYHEADANDDPAKQIRDIEALLTQGCNVLLASPAKLDELKPSIDQAMAQGVPVVLIDRTVAGENYVSYVTANNCTMGRLQAEWLVKTLNEKGGIVLMSGVKGSSVAEDRMRCAREVFAQYPGIKELAQGYANWSPVDGKKMMADWLKRIPQIDGIWADGSQGVGAVNAYLEANQPIPPITGCDINSFLKQWKQHGFPAMAVTYPARVGQLGVATALDILAGKPVQHRIDIPLKVITQANLDEFVRMDLPDGYWGDSDPAVVKLMFPQ
jgi:ribose transport system substrate-binding protein